MSLENVFPNKEQFDTMNTLLAKSRIVVDMLRGELAVLAKNQLHG